MKKKEIPLVILSGLKTAKELMKTEAKKYDFLTLQSETETSLLYVDADSESDFYFDLGDYKIEHSQPVFTFKYKPHSGKSLEEATQQGVPSQVLQEFRKWTGIIDSYNKINLSPDDKILRAYEDEFFTEFEIIDDDAADKPFNLQQQLYLDRYLEIIENSLEPYIDDEAIKPILLETKMLRKNITNETKKSAVRKFSKILSKVRKHGLNLLKEIFTEAKKQIIKRIINGSLDGLDDMFPM